MRSAIVVSCAAGIALFAAVGCERTVTSQQYVDNAEVPVEQWAHGRQPVGFENMPDVRARPTESPRVIMPIEPETSRALGAGGFDPGVHAYVAPPDVVQGMPLDQYVWTIERRLDELDRSRMRVTARADHYGAVGEAAIEPELRDFRTSVKQIEERMFRLRRAEPAMRKPLVEDVNYFLRRASEAVSDAAANLDRLEADGQRIDD